MTLAYRSAWGRKPDTEEVRLGLKFLAKQTEVIRSREAAFGPPEPDAARRAAVVDFCHALLNTNEFLYVD